MKLKRLELFGFKSFADRTVIEFDQGITGVVGPNGSGKSNISDAVRWVLGEQSAKSLRGGRMEDIIFGGSEKRKPLAYCEVSLIFDNEDRTLAIEYAEVAVTRRVYRSGDSEYFINRAACRLRDVVDLFRDSGIGREGYSIIGQGRVDEVLSNKPEDRRNIFHEAAGIMKFRTRKEEAERNLAHTQANLTRITDIMQVMESQIGPLKQQSENARTYLALSERLKQLEVNRFIGEYERLQGQDEENGRRLTQMEGVLAQQQAELEQRQQELDAGNSQLSQLEAAWTQGQQQQTQLQGELSELEANRQVSEERRSFLAQERERLEQARRLSLDKSAALREEAAQRQNALEDSGEARSLLKEKIAHEEQALAGLDAEIATGETELEAQKQQAMEALGRLGDVKSALSRMEGQRHAMAERQQQVASQLKKGEASEQSWQQLTDETRQGVAALTEKIEAAGRQLAEAEAQRAETAQKLQRLAQSAVQLREEQREARTRLNMLENMKRDYEGFNNTVKSLLKDARRDGTLGACVEAVVAEVVKVPQSYLLAVETALGAASQHVITKDEQAAKQLIGHLRARQYGRATFLPLTAIQGRSLSAAERSRLPQQGLCGVASELVECETKYRPVVDNLLGRTLIAHDLDAAIALSRACKSSLRVVTLQGDVMNPGGSMTGGSIRARVTSVLGRDQEIEQTQARLQQTAERLEKLEQSQQRGKLLAAGMDETLAQLRQQAHTLEIDLAREKERLDKAQANTDRHIRERRELEAEQSRLAASLEDLTRRMAAAEGDGEAIEAGSQEYQQAMAQRQRDINLLREQRDAAVDHLGMLRASAMADERDRAAVLAQIERDRQEAEAHEAAAAEAGRQAEENERRWEALQQEDAHRASRTQQCQAQLDKARLKTEQLQQQREGQRQRLSGLSGQLRVLEQENLKASQRQYEIKAQSERTQRELESLQNRIWELYELTYVNALPLRDDTLMGEEAHKEMEKLRRSIRALGPVNVQAIEEYAQVKDQYEEYLTQSGDLTQAKARLEEMIGQITGEMEKLFRDSFERLNTYFGETFRALFGGGQAFIKLEDEGNILESGIDMHVQPPGKKLQLLTLLSGGERALTAIALLFAMLRLKPTPFCILDEIEAALDEANISHFTDYVRSYAQKTQFVIITHRKSTMECCDTLYGVTMQEKGVSKMIRVRMSDIIEQEVS